jgi:hypothetical protein
MPAVSALPASTRPSACTAFDPSTCTSPNGDVAQMEVRSFPLAPDVWSPL